VTSAALLRGMGGARRVIGAHSDEFNDANSVTSLWGGLPTVNADINTTTPFQLHNGVGSSPSIVGGGVWQAAPAPPFTAIAKCTAITWNAGPGVGNSSIAIGQASPGPYWFAGVDVGTPGTMMLASSTFDSSGNFTGNPHAVESVSGSGYVVPHLVKIVVPSATSISGYVSFDDGLTWHTIFTNYNFGITPNYVGILNGGCKADWAWFIVS